MYPALQSHVNTLPSTNPQKPSIINDVFALYGRQIIARSIKKGHGGVPVGREPVVWTPFESVSSSASQGPTAPSGYVGILGAGMCDRWRSIPLVTDGIYTYKKCRSKVVFDQSDGDHEIKAGSG